MHVTANESNTQLIFMPGMFDETLQLLTDSHEYFSLYGPEDQARASDLEKMVYSAEMSRITLRLSSVMAWLMARRAEFNGQISREEAAAEFKLAFHDICLHNLPEMHHVLPAYMCGLMGRSLELYQRAARLDSMIGAETVH